MEVDKTQKYLFENLVVKDEDRFDQAVINNQELVIVSDGGLRNKGGFGWVTAANKEIIATCYTKVKGRIETMSYFQTEATGMYSGMPIFGASQHNTKTITSICTNNKALVLRRKIDQS